MFGLVFGLAFGSVSIPFYGRGLGTAFVTNFGLGFIYKLLMMATIHWVGSGKNFKVKSK